MNSRSILFLGCCTVGVMLSLMTLSSLKHDSVSRDMRVVCTTTILADAVRQIAGERVSIVTLMGPGVDPHIYRTKESDIHALDQADIIFYHGLSLEGKMEDIFLQMSRSKRTWASEAALSTDQLLASGFDGIYDPHIWHDVTLWQHVVRGIADQLSEHDGDYALYYRERCDNYLGVLHQLEEWIHTYIALLSKENRYLITAHDAFSYFGRAYGFTVIGLQGISTDAQISAYDMHQVRDLIIQYNVPAIFLESSIPARTIQAVQYAVAAYGRTVVVAPELFSDSLGDQNTTVHTYCDMIKHNVITIVSSLQRQ